MLFAASLCISVIQVSFKSCSVELVELLQEEQGWKLCNLIFNHFRNSFVPGRSVACIVVRCKKPFLHIFIFITNLFVSNNQAQPSQMLRLIEQSLGEMSGMAAQELRGCGIIHCQPRKAASCVFPLAALTES